MVQPPYGGQTPPADPAQPPYGQPYGNQPNYEQPPPRYPPPPYAGYGDVRVEVAVPDGDMVIVVRQYTPASPEIAAAEALLRKQYDSLKADNASTVSPQPSG